MYVTLFSSNIYMLVTYLFYVTQKTCICYCSPRALTYVVHKFPQHAHVFFLVYSTPGPMSSLDTVSKFIVSQWDHTSSVVGYHDHVSTTSSQRDCVSQSTLSPRLHDSLVNRCGCRSSSYSSPLSETRHVSGTSLLEKHIY